MIRDSCDKTYPDLFTAKPLTPEDFAPVWADTLRPRAQATRILPREQQIISAFGGESIFPPHLHDVMVRHGIYDDAPEWTPEEFTALWKDLRDVAFTNQERRRE